MKRSSIAEHEGNYLVAIERGNIVYITAHRPVTMSAALAAAGSMQPLPNEKSKVFVFRVLAQVRTRQDKLYLDKLGKT